MDCIEATAHHQMGAPNPRRITWQEAEADLGHRVHDRRWAFVRANGRVMTYAEPLCDPSSGTVALVTHDERVRQIPIREAFMVKLWASVNGSRQRRGTFGPATAFKVFEPSCR